MADWYLLLTPFLVLAVLALVRFVGCDKVFGIQPVDPPLEAPDAPTGLRVEYGEQRIVLHWNTVADATGYRVKVRAPTDTTHSDAGTSNEPTKELFLPYGQRRLFIVVALNQTVESGPSNEVDVTSSRGLFTQVTLGTPQTYYDGWMGMQLGVGPTPLRVVALGRVASLAMPHDLKITDAGGVDIANALVTVTPQSGIVEGQFRYGTLPAPVELSANTTYLIVARETPNADAWHDFDTTVSTHPEASVLEGVYSPPVSPLAANVSTGGAGHLYVPVNILYHPSV